MKPHTYSNVTINLAKRRPKGIQVEVEYRQNYGPKSEYSLLIKNAPKGLDLRMAGERDHLCCLIEAEINRLQIQNF